MDLTNLQNGSNQASSETSWRNTFLRDQLKTKVLKVNFIKKDGTVRDMLCTLNPDLLPAQIDIEESVQKKTQNPDILAVYDLEKEGWRSFRYDSVIGFSETDR